MSNMKVAAVLATAILFVSDAQQTLAATVGAGTSGPQTGGDTGTPTNVDLTSPLVLAAGSYDVLNFDTRALAAMGVNAIQPFLTTGGPNNHTVIWVGPEFIPPFSGTHNVVYAPGEQQFTLDSEQTIYAGVDSLGAIVPFVSGGLTDHNSTVSLGPLSVGQTLSGFSAPNLGRTYLFGMNVEPATTPLVGDLDGDGFVGIGDLNLVLSNWNQNVPPANPLADPSGDGFVGIDDLGQVLGNWNAGVPPNDQAAIPEPGTLGILGVLSMLSKRKQRE